jgi:AmiR/NasT family two-component response regulator
MPSLDALQQLRVLVVHPHDLNGETIIRHLQLIGCQVEGMWPPPAKLPERIDVVFYLIDDQTRRSLPWFADLPPAAIVAVVEHEAPDVRGLLSDCCPQAVVSKPVDPFAILTSLIVARNIFCYEDRLHAKLRKLEETIRSVRTVEKAKSILMKSKNIKEKEAYEHIRKHAMNRRMPIGKIASAIIDASDMLG